MHIRQGTLHPVPQTLHQCVFYDFFSLFSLVRLQDKVFKQALAFTEMPMVERTRKCPHGRCRVNLVCSLIVGSPRDLGRVRVPQGQKSWMCCSKAFSAQAKVVLKTFPSGEGSPQGRLSEQGVRYPPSRLGEGTVILTGCF